MDTSRVAVKYGIFISESVDERITAAVIKAPVLRQMLDNGETFDTVLEQIICAGLAVYEVSVPKDAGETT